MKHLVLTALLVSVTALAVTGAASTSSDALQGNTNVVRDFVRNDAADAWAHSYSWQWSDGILSHYPSIDTGTAQQVAMPAFDPGKLYRINIKFSNYLRGSVSVSLGSNTFKGYGDNGASRSGSRSPIPTPASRSRPRSTTRVRLRRSASWNSAMNWRPLPHPTGRLTASSRPPKAMT